MIVELGDHDMREQSRSGLAALNRQGRHLPDTVVSQSLQTMRFSTFRTIFTDAGTCSITCTTLSGAFRKDVPPQAGQLQGAG